MKINRFYDPEIKPQGFQFDSHGQIALANETRFTESHYSAPLTTYIAGVTDGANTQKLIDFVAPGIQVGRRFEYKKWNENEPFYSEIDDIRAIGGNFKTVEFSETTANDKTLNKGLRIFVDHDQVDGIPNWRNNYALMLKQRILRNDARRAVSALTSIATNVAKTWDASAGKDPDLDVALDMVTGADAQGLSCNRLLYGKIAWTKRWLSHRAQNTAGGFASSALTPDQLAASLGLDGVLVSDQRYQSTATTKTKIVPDVVLEFYALPVQTTEDPSNAKRFWSPCEDGNEFRVYMEEHAKNTEIIVEHYSNIVVTRTVGLRTLTIS